MPTRSIAPVLLALGILVAGSCASLDEIELGTCGNRVLDPGEDCDGSADCEAPDSVSACRYACDFQAPEPTCPKGFACGASNVCATAGDDFVRGPEIERGGDSAAIADIDGDRVADLALASNATRSLDLLFLSTGAVIDGQASVPIDAAGLVVGRANDDAHPDLVVASDAALLSLSSARDRAIVGAAFTPYTFEGDGRIVAAPARAAVADPLQPDALQPDASVEGVLLNVSGTDFTGLFLRDPYKGSSTPLVASVNPAIPMDETAPVVRSALIPRGPGLACDELSVLRRDANTVSVFLLCDEEGAPVSVSDACREGCVFDVGIIGQAQSAFAAQIDLDPETELLVTLGAVGEPPSGVAIVERTGPYAFAARSPDPAQGEAWLDALNAIAPPSPVLLVQDIDRDGEPDFVRADGVYLSNTEITFDTLTPSYFRAGVPSGAPWTSAAVGDFDGDGRGDVVGATDEPDGDVDVLLNAGLSYFNPRALPAKGQTAALTVGDFDGDGADDLVVRERPNDVGDAPSCSELDDLVMRFGGEGGLGARSILARIPGLKQMVAGRLPRLDKRDSVDDFGVVSICRPSEEAGPSISIAVFYGATNRRVAAPYLLTDTFEDTIQPDALVPYVPQSFAVSRLSGFAVALADRADAYDPQGVDPHEVLLFAIEPAEEPADQRSNIPLGGDHDGLDASAMRVAVGDLDGDGSEEIVTADPRHLHVVTSFRAFPAKTEAIGDNLVDAVTSIDLVLASAQIAVVTMIDIDADGADEILVGGSDEGGPFLRMYAGVNTGTPTVEDIVVDVGDSVTAIAAVTRPTGAPGEIDVVVALRGWGARAYRRVGGSFEPTTFSASMTDIATLAVGDVDGDQFEDVVLVSPERSIFYMRKLRFVGDDPSAKEQL